MEVVHHNTGRQEEARLEEGVGEEVEVSGHVSAQAVAQEHVADLRERREGEHPLDIILPSRHDRTEEGAQRTDPGDGQGRRVSHLVDRVGTGDQVDAGGDHGGRMDQGGDRGRALHGVRQPGVQRHLGRLGDRTDQQENADQVDHLGAVPLGDGVEDHRELEGAEVQVNEGDTGDHAGLTDGVHDERLHAGGGRLGLLNVEADQHVGGQADVRPAHQHAGEVIGEDQQ